MTHMEEGRSRFGFFGRLVGNDIIYAELQAIRALLATPEDTATLQAVLAKLKATDTVIDNIEPTQGVPQ